MAACQLHMFRSEQLDKARWDAFVANSPDAHLYAYSWYLDLVSPGWKALVCERAGSWEAVMPLPWKRKIIPYSFQPPFSQYNGILFREPPAGEKLHKRYHREQECTRTFLATLREPYAVHLHFHPGTAPLMSLLQEHFRVSPRITYLLDIKPNGPALRERYSSSVHNAWKRSLGAGNQVVVTQDTKPFTREGTKGYSPHYRTLFPSLWKSLSVHTRARMYLCQDPAGQTLAGAAVSILGSEAWFIHFFVSDEGREKSAGAHVVAAMLEDLAVDPEVRRFHFEGSMIPGVERFFRSFNSEQQVYWAVEKYRFPFGCLHR